MGLLVKEKKHTHEIVDVEKERLKKDLTKSHQDYAKLTKQMIEVDEQMNLQTKRNEEIKEQMNLWMRKAGQLQNKLSASLGHATVLEGVLEESNRTIESLQLALELREKEETEGLQNYIDELEEEIDAAVELITKYGLQLRKM